MDCTNPRYIRNPVFKSKRWWLDSGYRQLHQDEPLYVERPCGKCLACRQRVQNDWSFRIQNEAKVYFGRTFFVSMTMDNDSLHCSYHITMPDYIQKAFREFKKTGDMDYYHKYSVFRSEFLDTLKKKRYTIENNNFIKIFTSVPSIDKKDLQDYFKRLRKSGLKFHYFACGEYGDRFARSHYHVIFFTEDTFTFDEFKERIFPYWHLCEPEAFDVRSIDSTIGGIPVSKYVAKYSVKRLGFNYKDCQEPFALQSKHPAIGASYLTRDTYRQLRTNGSFLVYDSQGTRYSLPRFYRNKVFSESERKNISDSVVARLAQIDIYKARSLGMDIDLFKKTKLAHNRYLEKAYFDKLRISRFGYDFEICNSRTVI